MLNQDKKTQIENLDIYHNITLSEKSQTQEVTEPADKKLIGDKAEEASVKFLWKHGYRIIGRNILFTGGEIDILGIKDGVLRFVEVRKRQEFDKLNAADDVLDTRKKNAMKKAMRFFLSHHNMEEHPAQIDVVIVKEEKNKKYSFELIENALPLE